MPKQWIIPTEPPDIEEINGGNEFAPNDGVRAGDLNAVVKKSLWAADTADKAKDEASRILTNVNTILGNFEGGDFSKDDLQLGTKVLIDGLVEKEVNLINNLETEVGNNNVLDARQGRELNNRIIAETKRSEAAEENLSNRITQETSARTAAIAVETAARDNATIVINNDIRDLNASMGTLSALSRAPIPFPRDFYDMRTPGTYFFEPTLNSDITSLHRPTFITYGSGDLIRLVLNVTRHNDATIVQEAIACGGGRPPERVQRARTQASGWSQWQNLLAVQQFSNIPNNIHFANQGNEVGAWRGIGGMISTTDAWAIRGFSQGRGSNDGALEIATFDDGDEPIYVSQYSGGGFDYYRQVNNPHYGAARARRAALLDADGNTRFPGNLLLGGQTTQILSQEIFLDRNAHTVYRRPANCGAAIFVFVSSTNSISGGDHNGTIAIFAGMGNEGGSTADAILLSRNSNNEFVQCDWSNNQNFQIRLARTSLPMLPSTSPSTSIGRYRVTVFVNQGTEPINH